MWTRRSASCSRNWTGSGFARIPSSSSAAPGEKTRALVEFVAIYPSLTKLCGLPKPEGVEGSSFAPLLADPQRTWKTAAFSQYPKGGNLATAMRKNIAATADKELLKQLSAGWKAAPNSS